MRLLITGGAGFIGSHLAEKLLKIGHHVTVVDNLALGREANIAHLSDHPGFQFRHCDLLNTPVLEQVFKEEPIDAVFHLAANSDIARSDQDPDVDFDNTFRTTYMVLKRMRAHGVRQLIFASTSAVYGNRSTPLHEDSGPMVPVSHYGAAKLASEAFVASFAANYGIRAWIIRFPNVVGGRATHGVILDFIRKLHNNPKELEVLGNGEQNKPYLHIEDLVAAILLIWAHGDEPVNIFNVGVDSRTKVRDIAAMVIEEMGLRAAIRYSGGSTGWKGDVPEFSYSLEKIHSLGWRASMSSDEAVRRAIREILEIDYEGGHPRRREGNTSRPEGRAQANGSNRRQEAA